MPEESGRIQITKVLGNNKVTEGFYETLAPRFFVENNGLSVGDQVTTRLYYTDTRNGADRVFLMDGGTSTGFFILGQDGGMLLPFEEKEYTIVGQIDDSDPAASYEYPDVLLPFQTAWNLVEENQADFYGRRGFLLCERSTCPQCI